MSVPPRQKTRDPVTGHRLRWWHTATCLIFGHIRSAWDHPGYPTECQRCWRMIP